MLWRLKMTNEKLESLIEQYKLSNQEHKRIFEFLKQLLFSNGCVKHND